MNYSASEKGTLAILDETEDWIVVNKPAGLLIHPTNPKPVPTLWQQLKNLLAYEIACGGQISFINRLDRETSGIVFVAKTLEAARFYSERMERREFRKRYQAIVFGWPDWAEKECNGPILRQSDVMESNIHVKQIVHNSGAACLTHLKVLMRFQRMGRRFALVQAEPHTGRLHQIRVHLAHEGFPLVGDKIYGPDPDAYLRFIENGWTPELESLLLLSRHALHASELGVGEQSWRAPMPGDFAEFLGSSFYLASEQTHE